MSVRLIKMLFVSIALFSSINSIFAQAPQRSAATYDDWMASCAIVQAPQNQKLCELTQVETAQSPQGGVQGQQIPVGQITIARPAKDKPYKISFQVPSNAWLQTGVKLVPGSGTSSMLAPFRWCTPTRCLADTDLTDAAISDWRNQTQPGQIQYKDASQHDVSLAVSFKGFAPALDWMEKP